MASYSVLNPTLFVQYLDIKSCIKVFFLFGGEGHKNRSLKNLAFTCWARPGHAESRGRGELLSQGRGGGGQRSLKEEGEEETVNPPSSPSRPKFDVEL